MAKFELMMEAQHVFDGRFPDIPIPESLKSLPASLGDTDPVYMTLPVGRVDAESRNGRKYPRAVVQSMVEAINKHKPGGQKGHLRETDRPYTFDVPPIMWLAAELDSTGTAWAKGYVMPQAKDVRDYVKARKAAHAAVGTSLYGMGEMDDNGTVTRLDIETIDLVHPQRVGVPMASSVPMLTAETFDPSRAAEGEDPNLQLSETKDTPMAPEVTPNPAAHGLTPVLPVTPAAPVSETEQQRQHAKIVRELNDDITKLKNQLEDHHQIVSEMGSPEDPIIAFRLMKEQLRQAREENGRLLEETVKALVSEAVKVPTVVPLVLSMVNNKKPTTKAQAVATVQEIVDSPDVRALLATQVVKEMGDPHKRPETPADKPAESTFYGY